MTLAPVRTDVPYLRRRLKKGEKPTAGQTSTSLNLSGNSLSLSSASNTSPTSVIAPPPQRIPPLPGVSGKVVLSLEEPSVLLSRVQSAVGSLSVSGAEAFAWEGIDGFGALVLSHGPASTAPMFANRKLVEFHKGDVVVGLKHFRNLRRLIIGTRTGMLRAKLYDGSEIIADGAHGANALLISRYHNRLEFRLEEIKSVDLIGVFGIQVLP